MVNNFVRGHTVLLLMCSEHAHGRGRFCFAQGESLAESTSTIGYYDQGFVPVAKEASENAYPSVGLISERVSWELLDTAKQAKIHHSSAEIKTLMKFFQHISGEDIPPVFLHLKDITYSNLFTTQR